MPANWTDEQLDAICASGRAIVVSAAAGSGKTAVLVEKLRRMLCDEKNKISADRIAVVTFTNDAAAQMKQRLVKALTEELETRPESEWILSQLALIPAAKISTIHSFCFDLIRENAGLLGVDSGFGVLSPDDEEIIIAKAESNVFARWFSVRRNDMRRLTSFFCPGESSEKHFSEIIPLLREKILAQPFPCEYMDKITQMYKAPPEKSDEPMTKMYAEHLTDDLSRAADILKTVYDELSANSDSLPDNYRSEYEAVRSLADKAAAAPDMLFSEAPQLDFDEIKTIPAALVPKEPGGKKADKTIQSAIGKLRNAAIDICKKYCTVTMHKGSAEEISEPANFFTYENIADDLRIHAEICEKLFALMKDVLEEERRLKDEKNGLGFSDAEQLACELLCRKNERGDIEKTPLAHSLSDFYSIVMIDEFQDSTAVQELIFRMISKDGSADVPGTDFFAVGDVKQSIYRFRCADPRIFMKNIRNSVPYKNDGSAEPAHILLNKNFRSSEYVVDIVNTVFDDIMSVPFGGLDYGSSERLVKGAVLADDFGPTEIINIGTPPKSPGAQRVSPSDYFKFEAKLTAHRIKKLIDTEQIHDENGVRNVRPSDICILSRNAKHFHMYISALKELGIAAAGSAEESYLESPEILTLVNLLRAIDNPTLDIPMTAVLMSPMFMFSAEYMGLVRTAGQSSVYADISAINRTDTIADRSLFPDGFEDKCKAFCADFAELRKYAASHSVEELIRFIYDSTDFMSVVSILEDSAKKKANLRLLPVFAASYDKNGTGGLSGFVRRLNSMLESGKDFSGASAAVSSQDAVAVKTIHASKGLEYPFVFLCGTWLEFHGEDSRRGFRTARDKISFFPDYGAAFRITRRDDETGEYTGYDSFPRRAVITALERSNLDEEMMILYVALTRAKHKLFITRRTDSAANVDRKCINMLRNGANAKQILAVAMGNSHADWIDAALTDERLSELAAEGKIAMSEPKDILPEEDAAPEEYTDTAAEYSEEAAAEYDRLISSVYDLTLSKTSAKLTVTEIAKKHDTDPSEMIFSPSSDIIRPRVKGITAADRGTAVHAFMQYADFGRLYAAKSGDISAAVAEEAHRIASLGLITELQAQCAEPELIAGFINSGLFERMMRSPEIIRERKFLVRISDLNLDDDALMVYNGTEGMLQGVADCIFMEDGGYVIADYKTDRNVTADILADRYSRQLYLYARAFSMILDKPVKKAYLYSFSLGREIEINV